MLAAATTATNGHHAAVKAPVINVRNLNVWYGDTLAIQDVNIDIPRHKITALIGPSGCGKSTFLRSLNRMNDLIPVARTKGEVLVGHRNIYDLEVDPVAVRRHIGMVFQKPNPFPKSIYENVAWGLRVNGYKGNLDDDVKEALRGAALWDEVKDKLNENGLSLSGGQQQRLCIARALALEPAVLLMDEPCSALDPLSSAVVEDLIQSLKGQYTMVIVTHNLGQARRIANYAGFFWVEDRAGTLIEFGHSQKIFGTPDHELTAAYISGARG